MRNKFKRKIKKALDKIPAIISAEVVAYLKFAAFLDNRTPVYLTIHSINNTNFCLRLKSMSADTSLYKLDSDCEVTKNNLIESNLKIKDMKELEYLIYNFKHTEWEPLAFTYKRRTK